MGTSILVNQDTFAQAVLEQSYTQPVLVDFYATWCGPCQMLKPILETLVQEYDFVLAKVDIDANPDLANTYQVSGVPDVRVVMDGQVKPGFVGVLPEPQLRQLLEQLNLKSHLNESLDAIYAQAEAGDLASAEAQLQSLLSQYANDYGLVLEAANFYLEAGKIETAETLLGKIPQYEKEYAARARGLQTLILFTQVVQAEPASELDRIYQTAAQAALDQDYEVALQGFLSLVERDRLYRNDGGRKAMLSLFDLLGNDNPLVHQYRKQLMMLMY
ncbi:MAG: tetratricopeptide repeat protein [Synechococcales bacterium]|nr:tetratricopeptide repeat protein [Synechococcales bacterium]